MRLMRILLTGLSFFLIRSTQSQTTAVPVSYTNAGAVYTQSFDGLPNTGSFSLSGKGPFNLSGSPINASGLAGWQLMMAGGSNANAVFAFGTGSSTGNGIYSLGSSGSTDRALGSLASSTGIYAYGVLLTNNTGSLLNSFTLGFTTEQWRKGGSTNKNTWSFRYKTGSFTNIDQSGLVADSGLNVNSVITSSGAGSLNGNQSDNQQIISYTVTHITWKPGEQLLLRWDDADEAGSDDACAIDNLSFSASLISAAPTISTNTANNIAANTALVSGSVDDHNKNTAVLFEYDTLDTWTHPQSIKASPDTIAAGTGNTNVNATLTGLLPGTTYYWRIKASNQNGTTTGTEQNFTTSINLPTVITATVLSITTHTALLGGTVTSSGGSTVTERGIVWSTDPNPLLSNNKIMIGSGTGSFAMQENNLPVGKTIYTKAYATHTGGTAYGNEIVFNTFNSIVSLTSLSTDKTNADTVRFRLQTAGTISGINAGNFMIRSGGINNASIKNISVAENTCTITVTTGTGDGWLGLSMVNGTGLSSVMENIPFTSTGIYTIDKTAPVIRSIQIPDSPMKIADTVQVSISVIPDAELFSFLSGTMNGINLTGFAKANDSSYFAKCIIPNAGNDLAAAKDIPVAVSLADPTGNKLVYQTMIVQSADLIDVNRPYILSIRNPVDKTYKSGDTLDFVFRFSEPIRVTSSGTSASLSLTIGSRSKPAFYYSSGSDSVIFRYIIQPGESDKDGVRTASSILLNNTDIRDLAGNTASIAFSNSSINKGILIDAVAATVSSVTVPQKAAYRTGSLLDFVVNYSKKISINGSGEDISLQLSIGTKTRTAVYISGSGTNALLFRYRVLPDDTDKDGIKLLSAIILNNSSLKDEVGNQASVVLNNIGGMSGIRINPLTAAVKQLILPVNAIYKVGDSLRFLIGYNEKILVTTNNGIPYLRFTAGKTSRQAIYQKGSGTDFLSFFYIVQPGDEDTDGIKINTTITLNNGLITDTLNNAAPLSFTIPDNGGGIKLDGMAPVANSTSVTSKRMYKAGDTIDIDLGFSEKVILVSQKDTPFIQLTIGSLNKTIPYVSGSGTEHLQFRYIVEEGELDKNGIKTGSILINNQSLTDIAGNIASGSIKNSGVQHDVLVDGIAPSFITPQPDTLRICENSEAVSINSYFSVADPETNEKLNWKIIPGTLLGSLSTLSFSANANGKTVTPNGFTYTPFKSTAGIDSLVMEVSDSSYYIQKKLIIAIQPSIQNNVIGNTQIICAGQAPAFFSGGNLSGGNGTYSYQWEVSVSDTLHFSKASGNNTSAGYASPPVSNNSWFRRKIVSGACSSVSVPLNIMVAKNGLWLGKTNNWNDPENWCNAKIPDQGMDVLIYPNALNSPAITDSAKCGQLTLADKTTLKITGILKITGNILAPSGALDADSGTIILSGTVQQTISGNSFSGHRIKKLIINNPKEIQLQDSLVISGSLIMNSGSLQTNHQLHLPDGSRIGSSATGSSINGKVFIEHRLNGGRRSFHLLGHPFRNDLGLQMIKDSLDITGEGGMVNGFTATATNQPSAFRYNPIDGNDSSGVDAGWIPFTHTNGVNDNAWKKNTGIRLLMRGRPGQGLDGTPAGNGTRGTYLPQPVTLKISGEINTGDLEIGLTKDQYAGYNIVANPYPSNIDLSKIMRGNTVGVHYWIWDPMQGKKGGYSSIPFRSKYIQAAFGSFIVRANHTINNTLLFTENSKTEEPATKDLPLTDIDDAFHLELRLETDSIFWDRILLLAIDSARTGFDKNDAEKFDNPDVNFYSLSGEQRKLSTDARPLNNESTIKLGIQSDDPGVFRIRVAKIALPASNQLMLHDRYLNKWMPLEKDSSYSFVTTTDTMSRGNQRFEITAQKKTKDSIYSTGSIKIKLNPVPAKEQVLVKFSATETGNMAIRLLTLSGMPVKNISLGVQKEGQVIIPVGGLLKGIYLLEIKCGSQVSTQKIIKN